LADQAIGQAGSFIFLPMDLAQETEIVRPLREAGDLYDRLDFVVNCAGSISRRNWWTTQWTISTAFGPNPRTGRHCWRGVISVFDQGSEHYRSIIGC
jgi:NAD(P)-dependent dehydrogenase (short-subunit alcohol dehydrogenase family)